MLRTSPMRRTRLRIAVLFVALGVVPSFGQRGQTPDFSGTWRLDRQASQITPPAFSGGRGGVTVDMLHITQAANGTLIIGSEANGTKAWAYQLDGESTIPAGRNSTMSVTSRWDGRVLETEGIGLKERLSLSDDGETLTIEITITTATPSGERTNRLVYTKQDVVDPCESWSTPCREFR